MKTIYKILSGCVVLSSVAILPAFASAVTVTNTGFCANLNTFYTQFYPAVQQNVANLQSKIQQNGGLIKSVRAKEDQALATARTNANTRKEQYYTQLETKATTDEQKSAVQTFEASIDAAVLAKQSAIDAAIKTYRDGIDAIVAQEQPIIQQAGPVFQSAAKAAFDKATSSCNSGTSSTTVKATLKSDLKAAKDQFKSAVNAGNAINSQINTLKSARNAAYNAAASAYRTSVQVATTTLKVAFQ